MPVFDKTAAAALLLVLSPACISRIGTKRQVSFFGAMNMLGLAKRVNARILQASTSEVRSRPPFLGGGTATNSKGERAIACSALESLAR